jgi:hypothetical protein
VAGNARSPAVFFFNGKYCGRFFHGPPTPAYCPAHALRSSFNRFTAESNLTLPASSASQGSDFQAR